MTKVLVGTWEEIKSREAELKGHRLRVIVDAERVERESSVQQTAPESVLGKYAFVAGGSEEFAADKQQEITREDRDRG